MKRLIIALFAPLMILMAAGSAQAATGHPFLVKEKGRNPTQIAQEIEESLKKDPNGNAVLEPEHCDNAKHEHGCATPAIFLDGFHKEKKAARITDVKQLPAYFRSLVLATPSTNEYYSACLQDGPGGYVVYPDCVPRTFHPNEKAWMDPETHEIVLMEDCSNPVGVENPPIIVSPCAYIDVDAPDNAVGMAVGGLFPGVVTASDRKCLAYSPTGEDEDDFVEVLPDECPEIACNFARDVAAVRRLQGDGRIAVQWKLSKKLNHAGRQRIRVPPWYAARVLKEGALVRTGTHVVGEVVFCFDLKMPDGSVVHSTAAGIRDVHYAQNARAHVGPDDVHAPQPLPRAIPGQ